jgi:ureidoacrylate peracid hydrolase
MSDEASPSPSLPQLPALDPASTAIVFIEYQNEFCSEGGIFHEAVKECMASTDMLNNSVALASAARNAGATILHCPISFSPGHAEISPQPYGILQGIKDTKAFTAGSWGAEICSAMEPAPGDLIVHGKSGLCGFQVGESK